MASSNQSDQKGYVMNKSSRPFQGVWGADGDFVAEMLEQVMPALPARPGRKSHGDEAYETAREAVGELVQGLVEHMELLFRNAEVSSQTNRQLTGVVERLTQEYRESRIVSQSLEKQLGIARQETFSLAEIVSTLGFMTGKLPVHEGNGVWKVGRLVVVLDLSACRLSIRGDNLKEVRFTVIGGLTTLQIFAIAYILRRSGYNVALPPSVEQHFSCQASERAPEDDPI